MRAYKTGDPHGFSRYLRSPPPSPCAMTEGSLRSYDPLAYYVNNVSDLDAEVVKAHRDSDEQKRKELVSRGKQDFDIFICVNKHNHAFVLCVPCGPVDQTFGDALSKDPFDVPAFQMCWRFELCYENAQLRTYRIRKEFSLFKDIKGKVSKTYHVGTYKSTAIMALQFAAMRAAPHRYSAILSDCVEFSKEFCMALLSYCANWRELEEQVTGRIREASATGLSLERISRDVRVSGWLGSLSLRGADVSSLLTEQRGLVLVVAVLLLLVYPIIIAAIFKYAI